MLHSSPPPKKPNKKQNKTNKTKQRYTMLAVQSRYQCMPRVNG